MANQHAVETGQVLWNPNDIQRFIGTTHHLQNYIAELLTFDPRSLWLAPSEVSNSKKSHVKCSKYMQDNSVKNDDTKPSMEDSKHIRTNQEAVPSSRTDALVSVTTLGVMLLSTVTYQRGSRILLDSIKQLITESYSRVVFQDHLKTLLNFKKLDLGGLLSFVDFCIGHCTLCDVEGSIIRDTGVLEAWSDIVQPLCSLLDCLIFDDFQGSGMWTLPFPEPNNSTSIKTSFLSQKAVTCARFHGYDFLNDRRYQAGVQQIMNQLCSEGNEHNTDHNDLELESKIFFFSRFFQKVSKKDYCAWLAHHNQKTNTNLKLKIPDDQNLEDALSLASSSKPSEAKYTSPSIQELDGPMSNVDCNADHSSLESSLVASPKIMVSLVSRKTSTDNAQDDTRGSFAGLDFPSTQLQPVLPMSYTCSANEGRIPDATSNSPPYPASFLEILQLVKSGQEIPGLNVPDIQPTNDPLTESKMIPVTKPWMK